MLPAYTGTLPHMHLHWKLRPLDDWSLRCRSVIFSLLSHTVVHVMDHYSSCVWWLTSVSLRPCWQRVCMPWSCGTLHSSTVNTTDGIGATYRPDGHVVSCNTFNQKHMNTKSVSNFNALQISIAITILSEDS